MKNGVFLPYPLVLINGTHYYNAFHFFILDLFLVEKGRHLLDFLFFGGGNVFRKMQKMLI